VLTATVTATPVAARGRGSTIQHEDLSSPIRSSTEWMSMDVMNRSFVELRYRWSASLAMSTDGSFPSRPPQFPKFELAWDSMFVDIPDQPSGAPTPPVQRPPRSGACFPSRNTRTNWSSRGSPLEIRRSCHPQGEAAIGAGRPGYGLTRTYDSRVPSTRNDATSLAGRSGR